MSTTSVLRLLALSAIWGSSFLFMRIGAPLLGPVMLVPIFGILWGHLFLGESVGLDTLFGAVVVIAGTALVTGFSFTSLSGRG
jgi:drug/metabolite transporter (DMT)-like permease